VSEPPVRVVVDKLGARTRERVRALIDEAVPSVAPALALSVWQDGTPSLEAYAGWVDPEAERMPVGFSTLWDLASLTKLFCATALLRLAADARLDLEAPVVSLIPELGEGGLRPVDGGEDPMRWEPLPTPLGREAWVVDPTTVTVRQLLTHTSGLAPWRRIFLETGPAPPPPDEADPVTLEARWTAGLVAIASAPFVGRPGEEVDYSDLGYMLVGVALERASGRPLAEAVRTLIRDRLDLASLSYRPLDGGRLRDRVVPTEVDARWRGRRCWGEVHDENAAGLGGVSGHAGLFASAHDVARFGMAWLREDPRLRLGRFLSAAVTNQTAGAGSARGLGWQVQPTDHLAPFSDAAYGHTGFTGTSLAVDPRRDLVVALLTNRVWWGRDPEPIERLRLEVHAILAASGGAGGAGRAP
jgi:CubicO group peptidase (beta-lactamase class C family)